MTRHLTKLEAALGPRPRMALVIQGHMVREIWVNGRAPTITIRDYDWGETDTEPRIDSFGHPYTFIRWRRPAWALGVSLYPLEQNASYRTKQASGKTDTARVSILSSEKSYGR